MSIIFSVCRFVAHRFLFLVFVFNLKVTLGQICFAYYKLSSRTGDGGSPPTTIFNFQFKNFRSGIFSIALTRLSSRTGNGGSPSAVLKIYFDEIIRLVGNAYA